MSDYKDQYVFPLEKTDVVFPRMVNYLPYVFFIINYVLLISFNFYYLNPHLEMHQLVSILALIAILTGLFYPRLCVTFKKHMRCSNKANTLKKMKELEKTWEKNYRSKVPRLAKYFILFILSVSSSVTVFYSFQNSYKENSIVIATSIIFVTFALVRYLIEFYQIKFSVEKRK